MSNSILIDTYKIDAIEDTGYKTWLDFWLNTEAINASTNVASFTSTNDKAEQIQLPFNEAILKMLVREEFNMILEHLSCRTFVEFDRLVAGIEGPGIIQVRLIVRAVDGSVYFRQYTFTTFSYKKLKQLYTAPLPYLVWHERPMI